jgi:hypothetical protein
MVGRASKYIPKFDEIPNGERMELCISRDRSIVDQDGAMVKVLGAIGGVIDLRVREVSSIGGSRGKVLLEGGPMYVLEGVSKDHDGS